MLAPQTVNIVSSQNYYNVTFQAVTLQASANYYLNVESASGSPTWGYTTSPTTQLHATQDYWYSGSTLYNDNSYPNIFTVGYQATGPAPIPHSATFTESGLASGTSWSVTLGGSTLSSTTNTITFSEVDGSYSYSIGSVTGYTVSPSSGTVTINGADVNTAITYTPVPTYSVSFTESGLTSGTSWSVTLSGSIKSSTSNTITFTEVDGSYSYNIASVSGYVVSPSSGTVTVNGVNVNTAITFTPTHTVTFTESGLASGTSWSVTLAGTTKSSTSSTVSFTEVDGSYSYSIGSVAGYTASPSSGTVTVSGVNVNTAITFTQNTYNLTFTESGLPSGTSWSVTAGGSTQSSTTSTVSFTEVAGTYSYSIPAVSGYSASPSSGSVTISSSNKNVAVTFSNNPTVTAYSYVADTSFSYYTLPEAEQFNVGSTSHSVNFISVLLSGSGSVTVSIGSSLWGTDIVPAQTINVVSGQTNYTVSFSSVTLSATNNYYLNVQLVSGSVQWGYTSSPTAKVGATRDYWYSGSTLVNDNRYPNAYSVGYNTAGPAVITSTTTTTTSQMVTGQASSLGPKKFL